MDSQENIFKQFREHSVAEFFKKNRQMLGFSGKVRSLTTIIHEYITNSLDACEEAGILPEIEVKLEELDKEYYRVTVKDNGPGIPKTHIGKALAMMLSGTKFHRYIQQRGQQGIGASGCTMYSLLTTGKMIKARSGYKGKIISCEIGIDFKTNAPVITNLVETEGNENGLTIEAEFKDVKHEKSNYGVYEYLRRTVLVNPHAQIRLIEPNNEVALFPRSIDILPRKAQEILPHPLGINPHDLLDLARVQKENRKLSAFLQNSMSRFSANKVQELRAVDPTLDFDKKPEELTWEEAEKLVKAFKQVKWIAPSMEAVIPIGKDLIEKSFRNILNPEHIVVTERSPKVYRGGIPFLVEVGVAYGGGIASAGKKGEIMRFANRVPLSFDGGGCAITEAVKTIDWNRYSLKNFEEEPVVVLVNISSVYVPYTGAGKQAIASEEEVIDEIRNAVMESSRAIQRYLSGKRRDFEIANKKKLVSRYIEQLSSDLCDLSGLKGKENIKKKLIEIIESKYSGNEEDESEAEINQKEDMEESKEE